MHCGIGWMGLAMAGAECLEAGCVFRRIPNIDQVWLATRLESL